MREQIRNEQLTAVMTKLEGESGFLQSQNDTMVRKQEKLQVTCYFTIYKVMNGDIHILCMTQ